MGYFGLPSKACAPCRSRRIKCDLSKPSCGQCVRTYRKCFGYRDLTDLIFHDQTQHVICKAQQAEQPSQRPIAQPATTISPMYFESIHEQAQLDISNAFNATGPGALSLTLSPGYQAYSFFSNNYLSNPSRRFFTIYESIPELYFSSAYDSALVYVITAIGLAGLSRYTETYGMEVSADVWYSKALGKVNRILRDHFLAKEDTTLLVVLLLGLYETNTCRSPRSKDSWIRHIRGATALLDLRGEEQVDTDFGRTLFVQTRTQIIAGCVQTRAPIPEIVIRLSQKCRESRTNPLEDVVPLAFKICNIRSAIPFHPVANQSESKTRAIIAQYSSMSQSLTDWHSSLPCSSIPPKAPLEAPNPSISSSHHDMYNNIWTTGIANNYSAYYLLINESLIIHLTHLRANHTLNPKETLHLNTQITKARHTISSLIDAICATVPPLLQSNLAVAHTALFWGLYVSAQMPSRAPIHDTTRRWLTGRLARIGVELGARQSTTLAAFLHKEGDIGWGLSAGCRAGGGAG